MPLQSAIHYVADPATGAGLDLYAVVMGTETPDNGKVFNTTTGVFEALNVSKWNGVTSDYDVTLSESAAGIYYGALPTDLIVPGKIYDIIIYERTGAIPSLAADQLQASMMHETGAASLRLTAEPPQDCVVAGQSVTFTACLENEDGQVAPNSGNLAVGLVGAGSVVSAAIGSNPGLFAITYNSAGAVAGANIQVVISATVSYGTGNDGTVMKYVAVPIKVCASSSNGVVQVSKG